MIGWFLNLKLQARLMIVFSLIVFLGMAVAAWLLYNIIQIEQEAEQIKQESRELANVEGIQVYLLEQQLAVKNYQQSNDVQYLLVFGSNQEQTAHDLRLAVVDASTEDERDALTLIGEEIDEYNRAFEEVEKLHEANQLEAAAERMAGLDAGEAERVGRIHEQIDRFAYRGSLKLDAMVAESNEHVKRVIWVTVVALILFCGLTIFAGIITNQIAEPIVYLTNAVVAFENNSFDPSLLTGYLKRQEEVGQLTRAFYNMTNSITTTTQLQENLIASTRRFVPYAYLEFLEKDNLMDIQLGDHVSAEMGVMFSDIRSFTTISEGMTAAENFDFVNTYLKKVTPTIQQNNGFVVKFLGDGMMALFPYDVEDAVRAGIDKLRVVHQINAERVADGEAPIELGIGIHSGHMMVGMIGEEDRIQGDAFSDNVNLTSRIEGLNKFFRTSLIVSAEALARLSDPKKYAMRQLGQVVVKGRKAPIALYEIFESDSDPLRALKQKTLATYDNAHSSYKAGKLEEAHALFNEIVTANPNDRTAEMYMEQTAEILAHGKPDYWDGVIVMTSK